jgi:hypothetical protein
VRHQLERLYHLAEADNLESILEHGLLSTASLIALAVADPDERARLLRGHRPDNLRLPNGVLIRDQAPMPPSALAKALDGGLTPEDWYAFLNGFVFLWPDLDRMERQRHACGERPQYVLTFDGAALLEQLGSDAFVSPINSGNARRRPARRDRETILPYSSWSRDGWPSGQRTRPPAEVLFRCAVPAKAPFLLGVEAI